MRSVIAGLLIVLGGVIAPAAAAAATGQATAIVIQDHVSLRAAPRDSAQQQAVLWQGEAVEIRAERMDYLQVYDYKRERGGFVRASQVRRTTLTAGEAPELLSIVRFVRDTAGAEALGIGLVAAYIQAAPAEVLQSEAGVEALDALGTFADRLARRASSGIQRTKPAEAALSAHLDVAARYGIAFNNYERAGRMQICYDGDAFRRVLAMRSNAEQRARAVLALTRPECVDPDLRPLERNRRDEWKAAMLDQVDAALLPGYLKNRVVLRRAGVWSSLAYQRTRGWHAAGAATNPRDAAGASAKRGDAADALPENAEAAAAAANRAIAELAAVNKAELTDDDLPAYSDAAMRVSASRWAVMPAAVAPAVRSLAIVTMPGEPGETCISLVDIRNNARSLLTTSGRRCTYGIVWVNSVTLNREGTALAVAVQQTDTWRELWIFHKGADGWTISVLPPATTSPDVGYAEFAGWVPGGKQVLVAREARGEGKYTRTFELMRLDTLAPERQAGDPSILSAFQRWQDPSWKRQTLSIR